MAGASPSSTAPQRHPATLQWLTTINDVNSFETLSTILSALAAQHAACNVTWQPIGPMKGLPHIANLTGQFRQHLWQCGDPVSASLFAAPSARLGHRVTRRRAPLVNASLAWPTPRCYAPTGQRMLLHPWPKKAGHSMAPPEEQLCFAGSRVTASFDLHAEHARDAYLAARSLQRATARWFSLPPPPPSERPLALLLQRWPISRVVTNEPEVLGALRSADFEARAFVPERMPLAQLLPLLRRASLLVCVHGAGMINQAFMPLRRAAVIEAFLPSAGYNTGVQLSHTLGFQHLKLFLRWEDADSAPLRSSAAFNASSFYKWKWTQSELRRWVRRCAVDGARAPNLMAMQANMCAGVKKTFDYSLNGTRLAYLAGHARAFLRQQPTPIDDWMPARAASAAAAPPLAAPSRRAAHAPAEACAGVGAVESVSVDAALLESVGVVGAGEARGAAS